MWRLGHINFSPHGNLFRILRSGDRLEHTQGIIIIIIIIIIIMSITVWSTYNI